MELSRRPRAALSSACSIALLVAGLALAPPTAAADTVRINEIRSDQSGTDSDEYFELYGTPGMSLDGLTYLCIGDGAAGSGVIESVTPLTGLSMPADGYFVCAENTFTFGTPDMTTLLGFENADNVTHMLVAGFSGVTNDDLDTNDDGVFDVTPWTSVVDRVAVVMSLNPPDTFSEWSYGPPTVGPDGSLAPGHVYRNAAGWHIGLFDVAVGLDTPGTVNPDEPWALDDPGLFAVPDEVAGDGIAAGDNAGWSVAIDGDTAVVGASGVDSGAGKVLVYQRTAGDWLLADELRAPDPVNWASFGTAVDVVGDSVFVGASGDQEAGLYAGAVYVFERTGDTWAYVEKLVASDGKDYLNFGMSLAASGDALLVGSMADDPMDNAGAVYYFAPSGGSWVETQRLVAPNAGAGDVFGRAISLSGDRALIGAPLNDIGVVDCGSAYTFTRSGGTWSFEDELTPYFEIGGNYFGFSVALDGDRALVGVPNDDVFGGNYGSAEYYTRDGSSWVREDMIGSTSLSENANFGRALALDGTRALVGAYASDDDGFTDNGSVFVYELSGESWEERARVVAPDASNGDGFGHSVAMSDEDAVVGSVYDDTYGSNAGSAYFLGSSYRTPEDKSLVLRLPESVLNNDGATPPLSAELVTPPSNGSVELAPSGELTYTPAPDFWGVDSFTYRAFSDPVYSAPATVTITVTPVDDAPVATDIAASTTEDIPLVLDAPGILAGGWDADGDELSVELPAQPAHGLVDFDASGATTYTPEADWNGEDVFTYYVFDGGLTSELATFSVSIAPVNDAPTFVGGSDVTVAEDSGPYAGPWATSISAGPPNEASQELSFMVVADEPALFSVQPALASDGTLSFTPAPDAFGSTTIEVRLADDDTAGGPAIETPVQTFAITITDTYDFPLGATRVAAADRYATAIAASQEAFGADMAETVVLATGANWPDALGGSALAGAVKGPLLLTKPGELPAGVAAEVQRLGSTKVYILGGEAAISSAVADALAAIPGVTEVVRLSGADRYATASEVAKEVIAIAGPGFSGCAFVATGGNFPDALAASPVAAADIRPILLANPRTGTVAIPAGVSAATILGGTGAVSADIESRLEDDLGDANVGRIGGTNRYDTAARVAAHGAGLGMTWDGLGIATGRNFPDGLSGGAMLGALGSVMLLTPSDALAPEARAALESHSAEIDSVFIIGGPAAVSDAVATAIGVALGL